MSEDDLPRAPRCASVDDVRRAVEAVRWYFADSPADQQPRNKALRAIRGDALNLIASGDLSAEECKAVAREVLPSWWQEGEPHD